MKLYLAASYSRREELLAYGVVLAADGHDLTCEWISGAHEAPGWHEARYAAVDLAGVRAADAVVSFTETPGSPGPRKRGGRHVEFGIGLALGKRLILVGPREHCFHFLPHVEQYDSFDAARAALQPVEVHA